MRIEQWDPADEQTAQGCYQVMLAAHQIDEPVGPPISRGLFNLSLREGWEKTPTEAWAASGEDGTVVGFYQIFLPDLENLNRVTGGPTVHPAVRRRGIGRELLRHAGSRAQAHGRSLFGTAVTADSAGEAFARALGAKLDLEEVRRIQYLDELPPETTAALRATAEKAAAGYSLVSWAGAIPEEYCGPMAEVLNAFNDAPHGENEEPELWDAARVRERTGVTVRAGLMRGHSVAAICDGCGELAAFSEVLVDPESPEWGFQQLTAVIRAHRGHRLGLLVKTAMLELLASAEPQLKWIETGNAATNEHMIAVNRQLGYKVVQPGWNSYEMPVADINRQS